MRRQSPVCLPQKTGQLESGGMSSAFPYGKTISLSAHAMKRLTVCLNHDIAGVLIQDISGKLQFCYDSQWLQHPRAIPLSRSLPFRDEPFYGKVVRTFFAGLLPEESPRKQVASNLGIKERNDFAFLERIGGDCAGAVHLFSDDMTLPDEETSQPQWLSEGELQKIIDELLARPLLAGRDGVRLSLAGAQSKLPIIIKKNCFALPLDNLASTHIIKPEPEYFPGLVSVELLCMNLAKAVGLPVPMVSRCSIGERPCLIVERYDRIGKPNGTVRCIHQEDFCQCMNFPPERKYQQDGGPLLRDCFAMLKEWSTTPELDIRNFLDGVIFNILTGNADAHGKNYSLLYHDRERRLAPFYDLICTLAWPEISKKPAMKIGRSDSIDAVRLEHWQKMSKDCDLEWSMVKEQLTRLCCRIQTSLSDPALRKATGDDLIFERISGIILKQVAFQLQISK